MHNGNIFIILKFQNFNAWLNFPSESHMKYFTPVFDSRHRRNIILVEKC